MLTIPSEVADLIASGQADTRVMFRLDFDDGPEGIWNGDYDATVTGVLYKGLAGNMTLGDIQSSIALDADWADLQISGLLPTVAQMLEGGEWHQRPAVISIAVIDLAGNIVHVIPRFSGFLDEAPLAGQADEPRVLAAKIESNNRGLYRESSRISSDSDQRQVPGAASDGFFKYCNASEVAEASIPWGRKGEQYPVRLR